MADKPPRSPDSELTAYERWELPTMQGGSEAFNRAKALAARLKPLTAQDIETIRQKAYNDGFEQGKSEGFEAGKVEGLAAGKEEGQRDGLAKGLAQGQQQITESVARLKSILAKLLDPLAAQQELVEQATLNVALALARAVIHRELKQDSSSIGEALTEIFRNLPKSDLGLKIRINPMDTDQIKVLLDELKSVAELSSDAAVAAGGCVIETSTQLIDYTIEKRFQKAVQVMLFKASQSASKTLPMDASTTIKALSEYPSKVLDEAEIPVAEGGFDTIDTSADQSSV